MVKIKAPNPGKESAGTSTVKMIIYIVLATSVILSVAHQSDVFASLAFSSLIHAPDFVKKTSGEKWKLWDGFSPLFQGEKYECSWVKYVPYLPPSMDKDLLNYTTSTTHEMCVHPDHDIVSEMIRRMMRYGNCDILADSWVDYMKDSASAGTPVYHFEVGANIGSCIMQLLLTTPDHVHFVAFEPHPKNLFCLTSTLGRLPLRLRQRVTVFPVALGSQPTMSTLHTAKGNYGNSAISKPIPDFEGQRFNKAIPIPVEVMDDLINSTMVPQLKVGVMKLDVQGFDCEVIKGMNALLKRTFQVKFKSHPQVLSAFDSCSSKFIFDQMRAEGFAIYDHHKNPVSADPSGKNRDYVAKRDQATWS